MKADTNFNPDELAREQFDVMGKELTSLEPKDTFVVDEGNFVRTGVPILHGILKEEISRNTWLVWCEGYNREVEVRNNKGEVLYEIPKLFVDGNVLPGNEHGNSFQNKTSDARMIASQNPNGAEKAIYVALGEAYEPGKSDKTLIDKFNDIFKTYGLEPIKVVVENVEVNGTTEKDVAPVREINENSYDPNDGDLL